MKKHFLALAAFLVITAVVVCGCGKGAAEREAAAKHDAAMLAIAEVKAKETSEHDAAVLAEQKAKEADQEKAHVAFIHNKNSISNVVEQVRTVFAGSVVVTQTKRGSVTNISDIKAIAGLHKIDVTECPAKFRESWVNLLQVIDRNISPGSLGLLVEKSADAAEIAAGTRSLSGDAVKDGLQRLDAKNINEAMRRVEAVAIEYDIQLRR